MLDLETNLEKLENELSEVNFSLEQLKKSFMELTELKMVLRRAQIFFEEVISLKNLFTSHNKIFINLRVLTVSLWILVEEMTCLCRSLWNRETLILGKNCNIAALTSLLIVVTLSSARDSSISPLHLI